MIALEVVVRKELAHDDHLVLAFNKANRKRILRLSNCQLIEDFENAIDMMNESLFLIIDLESRYMITRIHNNEDKVFFDILN